MNAERRKQRAKVLAELRAQMLRLCDPSIPIGYRMNGTPIYPGDEDAGSELRAGDLLNRAGTTVLVVDRRVQRSLRESAATAEADR